MIFYFLPAIPVAFIVNFYELPIWVVMLAVGAYVALIILGLKNQKKLMALSQDRTLELDDNTFRIKSKGKHPLVVINVNTIDRISISKGYGIPEESKKDIAHELSGEGKKNFIVVSTGQQTQRFDFIIESYYMLRQFEQTIDAWVKRGSIVERI